MIAADSVRRDFVRIRAIQLVHLARREGLD